MKRQEAVVAAAAGYLAIMTGLAKLYGPWGLIGSGLAALLYVLIFVDWKGE